jgi:hypothetical protein
VNTIAAIFLMFWLTGWTLAALRAGHKAKNPEGPAAAEVRTHH